MRFQSIVNFVNDVPNQGLSVLSPASGQIESIENIPGANHTFKYVGEGVAIKLEGQNVHAPIGGKVVDIAPSNGKVIIQAKNKIRFLLQLPFSHTSMNGLGIKLRVKLGQTVELGQLLFELDLYKIKLKTKPVLLYFLILDHQKFKSIEVVKRHIEAAKDPIFSLLPLDPPRSNKNKE